MPQSLVWKRKQEGWLEYGGKGDERYVENLVLKGGMFLYTISNYEGRPTMDIDFMLRRMSNDVAGMERIMEKICQTDTRNDFIIMEVLGTRKITPEKKYPGISINLMSS